MRARFARLALANFAFDLAKNAASVEKVRVDGGSVQAWRDAEGNVTTLGRGGSDTSAVAVAAGSAPNSWSAHCSQAFQ